MRFRILQLVVLFWATQAYGSIWQVERDGSGDFSLLQDAADAAASGDTIMVGSGRYDESQNYGGLPESPARMIIGSKDLVVIGESDGSTVLGPDTRWAVGDPYHHGIVLISDNKIVVENIVFTHLHGGIKSWLDGDVEISRCGFVDNHDSVLYVGGHAQIQDCNFSDNGPNGDHVAAYSAEELVIDGCAFEIAPTGSHLTVAGTDASISNCQFRGGSVAMTIDRGSIVEYSNCSFRDSRIGFFLGIGSPVMEVVDCSIANQEQVILSYYRGATIKLERVVITDIEKAVFVVNHLNEGYVKDSILAKGDRGVVLYYPNYSKDKLEQDEEPVINQFDMRNNDWGTTEPDSIQAWIEDNHDDAVIDYRVLWEPFVGQPLAVERSSLSGVKSMFR